MKIVDSTGRQIFLAKEFDDREISWDKQYTCKYANKSGKTMSINPLEILNGSGDKKVYKIPDDREINYALSKDDFVKHIIDKEDGFDFVLKKYKAILEINPRYNRSHTLIFLLKSSHPITKKVSKGTV